VVNLCNLHANSSRETVLRLLLREQHCSHKYLWHNILHGLNISGTIFRTNVYCYLFSLSTPCLRYRAMPMNRWPNCPHITPSKRLVTTRMIMATTFVNLWNARTSQSREGKIWSQQFLDFFYQFLVFFIAFGIWDLWFNFPIPDYEEMMAFRVDWWVY
jgi:hypothetical protein